jgi:hypothetical protein
MTDDKPTAEQREYWAATGCNGSGEYWSCHEMSLDYARLLEENKRLRATLNFRLYDEHAGCPDAGCSADCPAGYYIAEWLDEGKK